VAVVLRVVLCLLTLQLAIAILSLSVVISLILVWVLWIIKELFVDGRIKQKALPQVLLQDVIPVAEVKAVESNGS
jgi:hypothetical protein